MYRIGQFRKTQLNSYFIPLEMELDYQQTSSSSAVSDLIFLDACGNLSGANVLNNQHSYYLRFGIKKRLDSEQLIYLKIRNTNEQEDNQQSIEEFRVGIGEGIVYFETIISPNATYNQILWQLQRTALDYRMENPDGSSGRKVIVTTESYDQLIDVLDYLKSNYTDMEYLTKIGVQGPPSLLMCINGEPIRIGRTGIYEINNDNITITSISFIPKVSANSDYFIMDFQY